MKNQFVTYEIADKLYDLGFKESCFGYYDSNEADKTRVFGKPSITLNGYYDNKNYTGVKSELIAAPLWQQVIDWLFSKHNIKIVEALNTGWEVGVFYEEQKMFFCGYTLPTKESAIIKAIGLIKK